MKKTSKRPETRRSLRRMVGHGCVYKLRTRICGDNATHHDPKHPIIRYCYAHAMSVGRYRELEVLPNAEIADKGSGKEATNEN